MARSLRALRRAVRCAGVMSVGRTGRAVESRRAVTRSNCGPTLDDAVAVVVTVRRSNMLEPCVRLGRARREAHDDNMAADWEVVQEKKGAPIQQGFLLVAQQVQGMLNTEINGLWMGLCRGGALMVMLRDRRARAAIVTPPTLPAE